MASPNLAVSEQPAVVASATIQYPHQLLDSLLLYGTFSLLLFAPLAFGAVEDWAIFVLRIGAIALICLWALRQILSRQLQATSNPLFAPMLVFAILILAQIVLGTSAYRYDTVSSALLYCVYGILVFLAVQFLQRTAQVKVLAAAIGAYGFGVALFALVQSLSSNGRIYWFREPRAGGWIYGPYVSHNHYAGLMEMLFPIPLVIALTRHVRGNWRTVPAFAAVVMATTIFLSGSRGGMIAFLAQMVVLGILIGMQRNRRTVLTTAAVLVVIALLILWVGGQSLVSRIISIHSETRTELEGGYRLNIDRDGLRMFIHKPILGWGLGTFPVVYPQFRTFFTNKFINRAHNDYLQLLVETGALGFLTMVWFLVRLFRNGLRKLGDWAWDINAAVALAALLGCTGILVHSFVDSNLQIPANAAWFYVLCAVAAADTKFGAHRRVHRSRRHRHSSESPDQPAPQQQ